MGEIKSTLDLVMEKTRHLSLSEAEREDQQKAELKGILQGMVQKYQDETLSLESLTVELDALKEKYPELSIPDHLKAVVGNKLDLKMDNFKLMTLLREVAEYDASRLELIFDAYQKKIRQVSEKRTAESKKLLAETYLISGSAIVPNLETDEQLQSDLENVRSAYELRLKKEKLKLGV
jgi:hypothetical protein